MKQHAHAAMAAMVLLVLASPAQAATTTLTGNAAGPGGGSDNWNNPANWSAGIPSGAMDAVVAAGVRAQVNNAATPTYSGSLLLSSNATLTMAGTVGSEYAATGVSNITMKAGAKIQVNLNSNIPFPPIVLEGNASLESLFGASDWQTDDFAAITGPWTLTISGFNGHEYHLNAANGFSSLVCNASDRYNIHAAAAGAFGPGDVAVNQRGDQLTTNRSARLYFDVPNVMADTATLYLNGPAGGGGWDGNGVDWVVINHAGNEKIAALYLYGVKQPPGTYTSAETWLGGSGTLTVEPIIPFNPAPAFGVTVPAGPVTLTWSNLSPNVGADVYVDVWFGTDPGLLTRVVTGGLNTTSARVSAPVAATYYWRVDSYLNGDPTGSPLTGTLFDFVVIDTDGDGLPDSYELVHTSPPSRTELNPGDDLEPDGLTNMEEYQLGTNPNLADTDGDGLNDGPERLGVGARPPTNPLLADSDGDGLKDGVESNIGVWVGPSDTGTNPAKADTDGDGLSDGAEVNTHHTNPLLADSDGDGAGDWYEVVAAYTSPTDAASKPNIPYPLPKPDATPPATNKPVKVFILTGQSNMVGMGNVEPASTLGTLARIVKQLGEFPNLLDTNGNWSVRQDVLYKGVISDTWAGALTVADGAIGPELGFGHVMGYYFDEPVLLIKACIGNRALGWDFRPPGSPQYDYSNGYTYPAYGESPERWLTGTTPTPIAWYAGREYDECFLNEADWSSNAVARGFTTPVVNVVDVLDNFAAQYPQWAAQGFQIAGYVCWQGNRDIVTGPPYTEQYETNLVQFIKQLRAYYAGRYPGKCGVKTPFVLATGCGDPQTSGNGLVVANAQLAMNDPAKHPEFAGNVKTMDTRGYWRDASISPSTAGYHYNNNAETYMLAGDALGRGMLDLLRGPAPLGGSLLIVR